MMSDRTVYGRLVFVCGWVAGWVHACVRARARVCVCARGGVGCACEEVSVSVQVSVCNHIVGGCV